MLEIIFLLTSSSYIISSFGLELYMDSNFCIHAVLLLNVVGGSQAQPPQEGLLNKS